MPEKRAKRIITVPHADCGRVHIEQVGQLAEPGEEVKDATKWREPGTMKSSVTLLEHRHLCPFIWSNCVCIPLDTLCEYNRCV